MISRHWRGVTRAAEADNYVHHLEHNIFTQFTRIAGFVSATILRRVVTSAVMRPEAIRQFSGETSDVAVVPHVVQTMMVDFDKTVAHYEVVETFTPG